MPQLDSLLRIVDQQGANELRLGSDRSPSMFAQGAQKKLAVPATSTETLRELFGELLDVGRMGQLERLGRVELVHEAAKLGSYKITITKRPGSDLAFDAIVLRAPKAVSAPAAVASPLPAPVAPLETAAAIAIEPSAAPIEPAHAPRVAVTARTPYRLASSLDDLLAQAIAMHASDVHLSEHDPPVFRVHGRLIQVAGELSRPLWELAHETFGPDLERRLSALTSCDLAVDLPGGRGRVNVYASARGLAMAIRILPSSIPELRGLGFLVAVDELARLPHGLVLVTGATGSGKSTTLAALAQFALSHRSILLVTLEDPIEYQFQPTPQSLVRQRQIGRDVRDFSTGLRDALREDPDVILVGEMRDAESIQLALTAAETGHLVLASLHSRSAVSAVERIIDSYPGEKQAQIRVMLADSLRAVIAQRLLPREGGGRALAAEVLRVTSAVAGAIREAKLGAMRSAMQSGRAEGMIVLERALVELVRHNVVSVETARAAANDPLSFSQYLGER